MKKFLLRLLWFLPVPIVMAGVNYYQDSANLFSGGSYERGIARQMLSGGNVTRVGNYDERLLQEILVKDLKQCPDEVVLGSSRAMLIGKEYSRGGVLINNSVSGASLEDYLAVYELYRRRRCVPRRVLVAVDPWLLNDNHSQTRWETLRPEFNSMAATLGIPTSAYSEPLISPQTSRLGELFSFSYFKASLTDLMHGKSNAYLPTRERINPELTRLSDGSIYYGEAYRSATPAEAEAHARECIANDPIYSLGSFDKLSVRYTNMFRQFIDYMQKQGVQVEFIMAPYHPTVYAYFGQSKSYRKVFEAESWFRGLALQRNIAVYGSYDPQKAGATAASFYDGYHCKDTAIATLMSAAAR